MDEQWKGRGKYRPADGYHWKEATGKTVWVPCSDNDPYGRFFRFYRDFKMYKRKLRVQDRLIK